MELNEYSKEESVQIDSSKVSGDLEKIALSRYMTSVYKMMCFALVVSGAAAWVVSHSATLRGLFLGSSLYFVMLLVEFGLVFAIGAGLNKFESKTLNLLFVLYSIVNGITLSSIFLVYEMGMIEMAFFVTAGTFGVCSFVGAKIKKDLSFIGQIAIYALIGCIIATIVNFFLASSSFDWILTYVMLGIFLVLTAWDTQKLRRSGIHLLAEEDQQRWVVYGALELYLDFVNMFLLILKLLSRRD